MVYDAFMFFDELDMLEIRLNILSPLVDYFVISEATTTQMGQPKKMYFKENEARYAKFKDKIIYNRIDDSNLTFASQWEREANQKNSVIYGLSNCKDDDVVIFSDLDEIPNPIKVEEILNSFNPNVIYHFAQDMYYFFLNYKNIDGSLLAACGEFPGVSETKWLGTKICSFKILKKIGCDDIRHKDAIFPDSIRVSDGGWHFTYMGGEGKKVYERVRNKLASFSHSEFNRWRYYNRLSIRLSLFFGRDLLGRGARFKKVKLDGSYPQWILDNIEKYKHFIL